ncbi:hypothetical protein N7G274_000584 [Stereocaulon virgatum]|uniref:Protein YOP1 n=1 Tax=Stereocaulon virgatum TaxID=373712 RepID=A0ABR4ASJ7_9LECA
MFDILPNLFSSIITILFPIFASYKALRTSDPAQLTPWLMYWVVLSCFSLVESWTWFVLSWVPLYAYLRLLILSYLVLPQTQGAKLLYQKHVHPFLAQHEHDIDNLITSAHDRAKSAGLIYLKRAIEFIKENLLGIQAKARQEEIPQPGANYAQSLLSRFNLPSARQGLAAPAGDFYGLLSAALGTISASSGAGREAQAEDLSRSGTLIPRGMTSTSEKMTFLSTQRERLRVLLSALDKEASDLGTEAAIERDVEKRMAGQQLGEGLRKSRSEAEFEEIGEEELSEDRDGKAPAGGWMPWSWSPKTGGEKAAASSIDAGT